MVDQYTIKISGSEVDLGGREEKKVNYSLNVSAELKCISGEQVTFWVSESGSPHFDFECVPVIVRPGRDGMSAKRLKARSLSTPVSSGTPIPSFRIGNAEASSFKTADADSYSLGQLRNLAERDYGKAIPRIEYRNLST